MATRHVVAPAAAAAVSVSQRWINGDERTPRHSQRTCGYSRLPDIQLITELASTAAAVAATGLHDVIDRTAERTEQRRADGLPTD